MEIKVGGTCLHRGERVKIAAKYVADIGGYIVEVTNLMAPRWQAGRHLVEVLDKCVPPLDPEKYYYWVPDAVDYLPPKKKKVYK